MDGKAPVSDNSAASGAAVPISPPAMDTLMMSSPPPELDEFSPPPTAPTSCTVSPTHSPTETLTANGPSVASFDVNSIGNAQTKTQEAAETPNTPETATSASPQASKGDDTVAIDENERIETGTTVNGERNGGFNTGISDANRKSGGEDAVPVQNGDADAQMNSPPNAKGGQKRWFEMMPLVLQNFMDRDQEQIKQLALPRCTMCERHGKSQKAEAKCQEQGCLLSGRPMCASCWEKTHCSDEARRHRQVNPSNCPQCQLQHSAFWCSECDLHFCRECFDQIHSVPRVKGHRKLAMEDSPGSYLAKANWSTNFQSALVQMIAIRRQKLGILLPQNGAADISIGTKRKRDVEVITIDDSDEDDGQADKTTVEVTPSLGSGVYRFGEGNGYSSVPQGQATASAAQVQTIVQSNPASINFQASISQVPNMPVPEPIPFPEDLSGPISSTIPTPSVAFQSSAPSGQVSALFNALAQPSTTSGIGNNSSVGYSQWNSNMPQPTPASMNAATSNVGMAYASTGMSNGNGGMGTFSAPMYASSGMCIPNGSANAAGSTDLSNRSSSYISLASSVFAENPLIDSLLDRYNEANHRVLQLELKSEELSKQIAVATYKGLYAASPLMTQLNELKPLLDVAKGLRDGVLIVMIIQSNDIMNAVRRLRLNDLFDVPQVPIVSHRKVLQLSIQINKQKKATMEMNRKMSVILNEPPSGNASSLTASIRAISRNIQMLEESMKKLKKDREAEIVRIVQFSEKVREELKREFHRNVEVQREQQQQAQSFR